MFGDRWAGIPEFGVGYRVKAWYQDLKALKRKHV